MTEKVVQMTETFAQMRAEDIMMMRFRLQI